MGVTVPALHATELRTEVRFEFSVGLPNDCVHLPARLSYVFPRRLNLLPVPAQSFTE